MKIKVKIREKDKRTLDQIDLTEKDIGRKIICVKDHGTGFGQWYRDIQIIEKGFIGTLQSVEEGWDAKENLHKVIAITESRFVRRRDCWRFL
jgi:hypothetical protein